MAAPYIDNVPIPTDFPVQGEACQYGVASYEFVNLIFRGGDSYYVPFCKTAGEAALELSLNNLSNQDDFEIQIDNQVTTGINTISAETQSNMDSIVNTEITAINNDLATLQSSTDENFDWFEESLFEAGQGIEYAINKPSVVVEATPLASASDTQKQTTGFKLPEFDNSYIKYFVGILVVFLILKKGKGF